MTTELERQKSLAVMRKNAVVLRECLQLMQAKTRLLIENNISGLERILLDEAEALKQMQQARPGGEENPIQPGDSEYSEWISLRHGIAVLTQEIQFANESNAKLVQSGLQFCETLYLVLCPPQTYSPELEVVARPVEATFQAQY